MHVKGVGDLIAPIGVQCLGGSVVHLCFVWVVVSGDMCSGWNSCSDCGA